jgi:hypothetical protein
VIDVLIGYWVSYPSKGLKQGKSPWLDAFMISSSIKEGALHKIVLFAKSLGSEHHSLLELDRKVVADPPL